MNCKELESTLNDIAREALTDAGCRADAAAHAAECGPCAALLADARSLTAGLRALSAESASASAPPRVEAHLLALFRARKSASAAAVAEVFPFEKRSSAVNANIDESGAPATHATTRSTPVVAAFAAKRWSWSQTFAAAGMAAAAAVAFVFIVPSIFSGPPTKQTTYQAGSRQPSRTNITPPSEEKIILPPGDESANERDRYEKRETPPPVVSTPRANRGALMTNARYAGGANRNTGARPAASHTAANEQQEITTDFIPLAQGGGFATGEGGHVVRVELPRAALAQFGLPVNAESLGGRVKADVLLGEDGMARAIRFVR